MYVCMYYGGGRGGEKKRKDPVAYMCPDRRRLTQTKIAERKTSPALDYCINIVPVWVLMSISHVCYIPSGVNMRNVYR